MNKLNRGMQFLENLQAKAYRDRDIALSCEGIADDMLEQHSPLYRAIKTQEEYRELGEALRGAMLDSLRQGKPSSMSRFEDPAWYELMNGLCDEIEKSRGRLPFRIPPRPTLGTLPTRRINAMALAPTDSNDFVVAFEPQVFNFLNSMSKIVVTAIPLANRRKGFTYFDADHIEVAARNMHGKGLLELFVEVVISYLVEGKPESGWLIDEQHEMLANELLLYSEIFVMGHEYGHIAAGHLSDASRQKNALQNPDAQEVLYGIVQELEADNLGLGIMLDVAHRKMTEVFEEMSPRERVVDLQTRHMSPRLWGADFFFGCTELLERSLAILWHGDESRRPVGTHPPSWLRRSVVRETLSLGRSQGATVNLRQILERILARIGKDTVHDNPAMKMATTIESILERLWKGAAPLLLLCHERGLRPANDWR